MVVPRFAQLFRDDVFGLPNAGNLLIGTVSLGGVSGQVPLLPRKGGKHHLKEGSSLWDIPFTFQS